MENVKALVKRGKNFLKSASENTKRGFYDVACFEADQAIQLMLKAYILKLGGGIPKTHSIRRLLVELVKLPGKEAEAKAFISKNRSNLLMLEESYLKTRYSIESYEVSDARLCLAIARKTIKFVGGILEG